ncbi:hypothetical protein ACFLQT_01210 [Bacteroidota bacterium]
MKTTTSFDKGYDFNLRAKLTDDFIQETLNIYKPDYIFLKEAYWESNELIGRFQLRHNQYTKEEFIDYITASTLILYLSQLSYVLGRLITVENPSRSDLKITIDKYIEIRDKGNFLITNLSGLKFNKKIFLNMNELSIKLKCNRIHKINGNYLGEFEFVVEDGCANGRLNIAMIS